MMDEQTYMGQITEKNLGVYDIWRTLLIMNEENERQTWTLTGLTDLADSLLRTGGNVTPGIIEWRNPSGKPTKKSLEAAIESAESDARFTIYGGNRRYLGLGLVDIPIMKARVLHSLTDEERYEIQFVENATKTKIPPQQIGDSIWELYLFRSAIENGIQDADEIMMFHYPDYWSIPINQREKLSISRFADLIHKNPSVVRRAFRYQNTNQTLRRLVDERKIPYTVAAEFGRIQNKNDQMVNLVRAKSANALNSKGIGPYITRYLESLKPQEKGVLKLTHEVSRIDLYRGVTQDLSSLSKMLKKMQFIIENDIETLNMNGRFFCNDRLVDLVLKIHERLNHLDNHYQSDASYVRSKELFVEKNKGKGSLLDQILSGDKKIISNEKTIEGLDLSKADYKPFVSVQEITPCKVQPRTGFRTGNYDKKKFDDMVETIKKFGILQPILVRPVGDSYEVVVGETRYRAAKEAGLEGIDTLVLEMDDVTARILQIEEDFYEQVLPLERASKLYQLWNMKKKIRGDDYTKAAFCKNHRLGQNILRESLSFMGLDDKTKRLYETGLLKWQNALILEKVENVEQRFQYAMLSVILDISTKDLEIKIYQDKNQLLLPFCDEFDYHKKSIKGLQESAIDQLAHKQEVLYKRRNISKDFKYPKRIQIMENLTRREHYTKLFEITATVDKIYEIVKQC